MLTTIRKVVLTGVLAALAGAQAWAVTPIASCPFVIPAPGNYVVTKDLLGCLNGGIYIQASNVSVNLNGHIITGPPAAPIGNGISVNPGAIPHLNQIGISGPGLIQGFSIGISIQDSDYVQVTQTTVADNTAGIMATSVTQLIVAGDVIVGSPGPSGGLSLTNSTGAQVSGNQAVGNSVGISLASGDSNSLTGNVASGNTGSGIVLGPGTAAFPLTNSRVSSNTTNGNGKSGIEVLSLVSPGSFGNEIFSNLSSVGNVLTDLADDTFVPPCGTDFWSGNVFFTKNQACVK
ncbi:MAG: right-handed parallel beta-helix repeat-containing protein [Bryobacteraceae bacterium]